MMPDWLEITRQIQIDAYNRDPKTLEGDEQAEFIRWNILAAHAELTEALEETRWKPWATRGDDEPVVPNPSILASELVDSMMFIANVLVTAGVSDADFEAIYRAKWQKNIDRQKRSGGYISKRGVDKCDKCGRSFDDVGRNSGNQTLCAMCVATDE